jgi:hypothetical protein
MASLMLRQKRAMIDGAKKKRTSSRIPPSWPLRESFGDRHADQYRGVGGWRRFGHSIRLRRLAVRKLKYVLARDAAKQGC